jgi:hypothetical protein
VVVGGGGTPTFFLGLPKESDAEREVCKGRRRQRFLCVAAKTSSRQSSPPQPPRQTWCSVKEPKNLLYVFMKNPSSDMGEG